MQVLGRDAAASAWVRRSLAYPGVLVREPTVLGVGRDDGSGPVDTVGPEIVRHLRNSLRTPVLAMGSNGSVATLRVKLQRAGVSPVVPLLPAIVTGMSAAHSAHVSLGGYVAATAVDQPDGAARAVLTWFDDAQLAAIDATEPNYVRREVLAARYPLSVLGGAAPSRFWVYRSVWGALALHGRPTLLGSQVRLHHALSQDRQLAARVPLHDPAATVRRLATHRVQLWVREHWAGTGRACSDGLELAT